MHVHGQAFNEAAKMRDNSQQTIAIDPQKEVGCSLQIFLFLVISKRKRSLLHAFAAGGGSFI